MNALRTPDSRFENLPDYPFAPQYHTLAGGLRMHYVDEGPRDAPAVLMLHGEPTWSYLYRKMIPVVVAAGFRAIAPDLIGFGKSDKPAKIADYSYAGHVAWVREWMEALDLRGLTLFCQDWGSLIGLRLATEHDARFDRIVVANGFLPTGERGANRAFMIWRTFAKYSPWFPIGRIVANGCGTKLTPAEIAAYDAPYPSSKYKAGARAFPPLVPISADDPAAPANKLAWERLGKWTKPFLTLFGAGDPILGRADKWLLEHVPGSKGLPHQRMWGGHFVQEDQGPKLAEATVALIKSTL